MMYEPTIVSDEQLDKVISENEKVLVFVSTTWCGDCKVIKPFISQIKDQVSKTRVWADADRDENIDFCKKYNVKGIPTFLLFENGELVTHFGDGQRLTPKEIIDWYNETN